MSFIERGQTVWYKVRKKLGWLQVGVCPTCNGTGKIVDVADTSDTPRMILCRGYGLYSCIGGMSYKRVRYYWPVKGTVGDMYIKPGYAQNYYEVGNDKTLMCESDLFFTEEECQTQCEMLNEAEGGIRWNEVKSQLKSDT